MINGLKRLVGMVFRKPATSLYSFWRSSIPWYRNVTDVLNSSTVAATIMWCARNFPEAPPRLDSIRGDGQRDRIMDHPMLRLLQKPNPYYSGSLLWMATVTDWKADGNAYWLKLRDQTGAVAELWWIPSWMISPVRDDGEFIGYYEYTPNGNSTDAWSIQPSEIVHFRFGMDPENDMKGQSPLKSVLKEVYTDDEAATFTASILTNMGVPGVVISPEAAADVTDDDLELTKSTFDSKLSGTNRGGAVVMRGPTKVQQFGFSPDQLKLTEIRRVPEERVTACIGVPAIVVGLGAGLDRSTFTNMGEASEYAYSNGLIPDQRIMADVVRWQLLPEWGDDPFMLEFGFDLSNVRALQGDRQRRAEMWSAMVNAGWAMVSEPRRDMGLPVDEGRDNVFLRQGNLTMIPGSGGAPVPLAPTSNGSNLNGHTELVLEGSG